MFFVVEILNILIDGQIKKLWKLKMLFTCRRTFTMYVCIILEHYYRITFGFKFKCAKTSLQYKVKTTNLNLVYVLCIVFSKNIVLGMLVWIL